MQKNARPACRKVNSSIWQEQNVYQKEGSDSFSKNYNHHAWIVAQLCLTLCDPMDCSLPGSLVHRISQARMLEWVVISSSRGSSWPRDWTCVSCISCIGKQILYYWATWEAQNYHRTQQFYSLSEKKKKNLTNSKGYIHPMFIAALFTVAKIQKQNKFPSTDEWMKKWCKYMH